MKLNLNRFYVQNFDLIRTIIAISIGFVLSLVCILFISDNPVAVIGTYITKPFDGIRRIGTMIEYMIPIICTGVGMCFMLSVSQFNLIGEGVVFFSASFITYVATQLTPNLPPVIFPLFLIFVGALVGGTIASVPALLQLKWKTNIVVSTIMLNYVLLYGGIYVLYYWMRDPKPTYVGSYAIPSSAKLTYLIPKTQVHTGIFVAVAVLIFAYWFLFSTKKGYEMRLIGRNEHFARYSGVNIFGTVLLAQVMGGAMAGIGGTLEQLGRFNRFIWLNPTGYGFDGMMLALIAGGNPLIVPIAAFFLAYIRIGADIVGQITDVPMEFVQVIQAIIIMLVAAQSFLAGSKQRAIVTLSTKDMKEEAN